MSRLLLLEDDLSLIDGLKYSLEKNGFELDVARSVTEAISERRSWVRSAPSRRDAAGRHRLYDL